MTTTLQSKSLTARSAEVERELVSAGFPAVGDAEQAKAALHLENSRTIHRLIERGQLVAFRIGGRFRIRRGQLAAYIARQENQ